MERTLTVDEVIQLVKQTPEKTVFDWKSDFVAPVGEEKQGEFLKDLAAIANACSSSYGFIVYGVDPRKPDPVLGISSTFDDAKLQQLVNGKIEPRPNFLYYEVATGPKTLGVLQVKPTRQRPHIIRVDLGKVRKGQILIRRGSSTDGATMQDLYDFFYSSESGHFQNFIQHLNANAYQKQADVNYIRTLQDQGNRALQDMEIATGVPRGSLGAKY